jgi:hypothetical protein
VIQPGIWRKSTYSHGDNTDCVELSRLDQGAVGIRDSKNPNAGHLSFDPAVVRALITQVKAGKLDL